MGENAKEWMMGKNIDFEDMGVDGSQHFVYGRDSFVEIVVGAQKCHIFIHLSLHHSSHFIAPLTFHDIISINILGFHLIVLHFIHFSIKREFLIKC
jgi:hypothetical protein